MCECAWYRLQRECGIGCARLRDGAKWHRHRRPTSRRMWALMLTSAASSRQALQGAGETGAGAYPAVALKAGVEAHAHIAHIHAQAEHLGLVVVINRGAFRLERLQANKSPAVSVLRAARNDRGLRQARERVAGGRERADTCHCLMSANMRSKSGNVVVFLWCFTPPLTGRTTNVRVRGSPVNGETTDWRQGTGSGRGPGNRWGYGRECSPEKPMPSLSPIEQEGLFHTCAAACARGLRASTATRRACRLTRACAALRRRRVRAERMEPGRNHRCCFRQEWRDHVSARKVAAEPARARGGTVRAPTLHSVAAALARPLRRPHAAAAACPGAFLCAAASRRPLTHAGWHWGQSAAGPGA
jgi:hypothetical protein